MAAQVGTILPDGAIEIAVSRAALVGIPPVGQRVRRFVLGPSDEIRRVRYGRGVDLFGVRLRPAACRAVLPGRAAALADLIVPLGGWRRHSIAPSRAPRGAAARRARSSRGSSTC